jgi:hypothetical protein
VQKNEEPNSIVLCERRGAKERRRRRRRRRKKIDRERERACIKVNVLF